MSGRRTLRRRSLRSIWNGRLGPFLVSTVGEGGSRAVNFVFYIVVARALSPAGFGQVRYSIVIALVASGAAFVLSNAVSRELGAVRGDDRRTGELLGTALVLALVLWLVSSALCLAAGALGLTGSARPVGLLAALTGLTVFQLYYQAARGVDAPRRAALTYLAGAATSLMAFLLLWALIEPTATLTLIVFGAGSIVPVVIAEWLSPVLPRPHLTVGRTGLRRLWRTGGPLLLAGIGYLIWNSVDQIWVEAQLGTHEIGLYGAARNLAVALVIIPSGVVGVLVPRVAELVSAEREDEAGRLLLVATAGATAATGAVAVVLLLLRGPLLAGLYGAAYRPASAAVVGLCAASVLYAAFVVLASGAVGWGRPRVFAIGVGVAAAAELVMLLLTTSRHSSTAAWAYAASMGLALALTVAWLSLRPLRARRSDRAGGWR
jgi:O-antigen/teichoic acid export membrane protein